MMEKEIVVNEVVGLLSVFAELEQRTEALEDQKQREIQDTLGPKLYAEYLTIRETRDLAIRVTRSKMDTVKEQIQDKVAVLGETVAGLTKQAVYTKPRVSWDTKALDGYAAAHPEIVPFKTVGKASVSIRAVKEGN